MDLSSARGALVEEAREQLTSMESALLAMESLGASRERINAVFRAAHTIKGSASLFDLHGIVEFAHALESLLDRLRSGQSTLSPTLLTTLLQAGDYLAQLIDYVDAGREEEEPDGARRQSLLRRLQALASDEVAQQINAAAAPAAVTSQPEEHRSLRVQAAKLDSLIDLVGELVIAASAARVRSTTCEDELLSEAMNEVEQLVHRVREDALSLRMVPISEVFRRFTRIVRDLSHSLGKRIELDISGEETELDKSMVEHLADPLIHLVRNAIDHGIEPAEERIAAGKLAVGRIGLHARHESGYVIVEVADDGRGLNAERIRRKAIEQGLLAAPTSMTNALRDQLIFEPGLSTRDTVDDLSGRGVGLDAVRRAIEALSGQVEVDSQPQRGSVFRIRLPLTLAIINGFQVAVGNAIFVIPMDAVVECIDMNALGKSAASGQRNRVLRVRGESIPYLRLRDLYELPAPAARVQESVVLVRFGHQRIGIVVDDLLGEFQSVIKPLGDLFRGMRGLGGSTLLPNGNVALILDVVQLLSFYKQQQEWAGGEQGLEQS